MSDYICIDERESIFADFLCEWFPLPSQMAKLILVGIASCFKAVSADVSAAWQMAPNIAAN